MGNHKNQNHQPLNVLDIQHQQYQKEQALKLGHLKPENLSKVLNIKGIENLDDLKFDDCSVSASDLIAWAVKRINYLDAENERMSNALEYVLESGAFHSYHAEQKLRWGLGIKVENEPEIAALKARYS